MNKLHFYYQYAPKDALTRGRERAVLGDAIHMVRDREIFSYMILQNEYTYGSSVLNLPPTPFNRAVAEVPLNSFHSSDLIILNTRPPLPKESHRAALQQETGQRRIAITGQNLERIILRNIRRYAFEHCSRKKIVVRREVFDGDPNPRHSTPESRCAVFRINPRQCWVERMGCTEDQLVNIWDEQFTLGYIIYLSHLYDAEHDGLPGLLCTFSIGGTASLLFSLLVFRQYADVVRDMVAAGRSRLIMAKLSFGFGDYRHTVPPFLENVPVQHEILNDFMLNCTPTKDR